MIIVLFKTGFWKVADFGLTSEATSNQLVSTSAARGKPCYRAPEMLRNTSPGFNNKMDIWSFGCIAYELLTGRKAFSNDYEVFLYSMLKKKPKTYFKHTDSVTKFYIADLFELEPDNRPAARELLKLKFIGETPLANPTISTSMGSQKKRRVEQQAIPQSEFLTASLKWADSNGNARLISMMLGCGINPKHDMISDGVSVLMQAISLNSLEVMERFTKNGLEDIYPGLRQAIVRTVAPSAAEERQLKVAKRLVEYGPDISAKDNDGWTMLHAAAQRGHGDMIELLLSCGACSTAKEDWRRTPLSCAAEKGHLESVKLLVGAGADVESKDREWGRTPLSWAAENGHLEVVEWLVREAGAEVESKDKEGWKPLGCAAENGHLEVVKLLVQEAGAKIETKTNGGWTPLLSAAENGHLEVVKWLAQEAGAKIETKDNGGLTPLSWAVRNGNLEVVKWLTQEAGADIESKDKYGRTPLSRAAKNGELEAVKWLAGEAGSDVESKDKYGQTPLSRAAENGELEAVKWLAWEAGADVESKDERGRTPLSHAAIYGHLEAAKWLVKEAGAKVESKDYDGKTALDLAADDTKRLWETEEGWKRRRAVVALLEGMATSRNRKRNHDRHDNASEA